MEKETTPISSSEKPTNLASGENFTDGLASLRLLSTNEGRRQYSEFLDQTIHQVDSSQMRRYKDILEEQDFMSRNNAVLMIGEMADTEAKGLANQAANATAELTEKFIDPDILNRLQGNLVVLRTSAGSEIELPTAMFVSAEGFESWQGRNESNQKDGQSSSETIQDYASRDTQAPPLSDVAGYLLPDGRLFFKSNNSHRIAAARLRGDKTVAFRGVMQVLVLAETPDIFNS
jgi:hypothetical protein